MYIGKNVDCKDNNNINNINMRNMQGADSTINEITNDDGSNYITHLTDIPTPLICGSGTFKNEREECIDCHPLCAECESLEKCTECKKDNTNYIIKNGQCISCFSSYEGCEKCNEQKCTNCYNNYLFKFELDNNGKCQNKQGDNNKIINLKYERFDGYKKKGDTAYFNCHFSLLNNYLSNAKLTLVNTMINTIAIKIRDLDTKNIRKIDCEQYGDSLGSINKGGYLANFQCSLDLPNEELISIKPEYIEIDSNINIKDFISEEITDLSRTSLDIEYEDKIFIKFSISIISNIKLKDDLTFTIIGEYDKPIGDDYNTDTVYNLKLKYNNSNEVIATCSFKEEKNDTLSCTLNRDYVKEKETLSFIEGICNSTNDNLLLILSNLNNETIEVPKSTLSVGAIVGITIAGIVILVPFIYYIVKYFIEKKELNNENEGNGIGNEEVNRAENIGKNDNSKGIIFNLNS